MKPPVPPLPTCAARTMTANVALIQASRMDTRRYLKGENIHTSAVDKELPTIACDCGYSFCKTLSELERHLHSDSHQTHMKADREVEEEDAEFHCPECDQAVQRQWAPRTPCSSWTSRLYARFSAASRTDDLSFPTAPASHIKKYHVRRFRDHPREVNIFKGMMTNCGGKGWDNYDNRKLMDSMLRVRRGAHTGL